MLHTAQQFIATTQSNLHALKTLSTHALTSLEKLTKLNAGLTQESLQGAFSQGQELLDIKNPQQLLAQQVALLKPLTEKTSAYAWEVFALAFESGTEFNKVIELKRAEAQKNLFDTLQGLAKNVPMSTESAMSAFKNAISAGQHAIVSAQSSAKKSVELAQASVSKLSQPMDAPASTEAKAD